MGIDDLCAQCGLYQKDVLSPNMGPSGAKNPLLYVVGKAPDKREDRKGTQFSGDAGEAIKDALRRVGANLRQVRYYNVVNCHPPGNKCTPLSVQVCSQRVRADIRRTKPRAVLVLGNEAITGLWPSIQRPAITRVRGNTVPIPLDDQRKEYATALVTFDTNYILSGTTYEYETAWLDDIALAWDYASTDDGSTTDDLADAGILDPLEDENRVTLRYWSDLKDFFPRLMAAERVSFDWETTSLKPWVVKHEPADIAPAPYSIAWAFDDKAYALKLWEVWNEKHLGRIYEAIGKWLLEADKQTIIAHNLKFELLWWLVHALPHYVDTPVGEVLRTLARRQDWFDDTMLMTWLNDERGGASRLKVAGWAHLGMEDWSHEINVKNIVANDTAKVLRYNQDDAYSTLKMWEWGQARVLSDPILERAYRGVMLPAAFAFTDIELRGTPVDDKRRLAYAEDLEERIEDTEREMVAETGIPDINVNSTEQLARYFVEDCEYRMIKQTKKSWSTDEESLQWLVAKYNDPVAKLGLGIRSIAKLNGTYARGLDKSIYVDGNLHASYNLAGTVTGRTSSDSPNMQNFPKRKEDQKYIRRIVVPPPGYKLCSFDYGQVEARLFAVITADEQFIEDLHGDLDIHLANAMELFGEEDGPAHRGPVKNGTFAMFYGAGDPKISGTTGAPIEAVGRLRKLVFGKYRAIKPWQAMVQDHCADTGYVESLFGRRRRAPMAYTEILNHTNQSTASDMTLTAMNTLWWSESVALMIHDDLSFYIKDDENLPDTLLHIARVMLATPWWFMHKSEFMREWVPMQVECAVGNNWCDLKEVFKVTSFDMGQNNLEQTLDAAQDIFEELEIPGSCIRI